MKRKGPILFISAIVLIIPSQTVIVASSSSSRNYNSKLEWNRLTEVSLRTDSEPLAIGTPSAVPSDTAFLMLQGHQLPSPLSDTKQLLQLSKNLQFNQSSQVSAGHHIGLISMATNIQQWYTRLAETKQDLYKNGSTTAWLLIVAKDWSEPLPGGCCANRSTSRTLLVADIATGNPADTSCDAIGPVVRLSRPDDTSGALWHLDFEPAAALNAAKPTRRICGDESDHHHNLYRMRYRLYVTEASRSSSSDLPDWVSALRLMSTAQEAVAYGHLIGVLGNNHSSCGNSGCCRFTVATRDNLNLIATVIAERIDTSQFSAYTPVLLLPQDGYGVENSSTCFCLSVECRIVTILAACIGLFLCTVGFRLFAVSVFLSGFIVGSLAVLPITLRNTATQLPLFVSLLLGCLAPGIVIGGLVLAVWLRKRCNAFAYLILHLPCCYALASLLFVTPFGRLWWLTGHEAIFLGALGTALLLCLLLLMLFHSSGAIFSLSFVGTFMLASGLLSNLPTSTTFPYVFMDLFRRTATENYNGALFYYEFRRVADLVALIAWPALTAVCCLLQYRCNIRYGLDPSRRGIEPSTLPPPPLISSLASNLDGDADRRRQRQQRVLNVSFGGGANGANATFQDPAIVNDERTPLLRAGQR